MHHPQEQYIEEGVDWESIVVEYNQPLQDTFEQVSAIHTVCVAHHYHLSISMVGSGSVGQCELFLCGGAGGEDWQLLYSNSQCMLHGRGEGIVYKG